jgi:phosphatidylglycerophosphate synthase
VGLLACALFAAGSLWAAIAGALAYSGFLVVDSVDGNIARLLKTSSKKGEFLDALVGDLIGMLIIPCVAVGLARGGEALPAALAARLPAPGMALIAIAIASALLHQSVLLLWQRKKVILPPAGPKRPNDFGAAGNPLKALFILVARNLTGFPFLAPALILAAVAGGLWLLVAYVALSNLALFLASFAYGVRTVFAPEAQPRAAAQRETAPAEAASVT